MENQWFLADGVTALEELGFDTVDELVDYYAFNGHPQKIDIVLLDSNDNVLETKCINTKTIL